MYLRAYAVQFNLFTLPQCRSRAPGTCLACCAEPTDTRLSTASSIPDCHMLGLRGIFIVLSGAFALLVAPVDARKTLRNAPQCVLKAQTSPKMPPAPIQCPCGPTIVQKPIGDSSAEVLIVYEAWAGYCKSGSPWLDSTAHRAEMTMCQPT